VDAGSWVGNALIIHSSSSTRVQGTQATQTSWSSGDGHYNYVTRDWQ